MEEFWLPSIACIGGYMARRQPPAPRDHAAFTPQANHAGCPALTIPFARTHAGLPIGLQIIAARGRDADLLATARTITAAMAPKEHERAT